MNRIIGLIIYLVMSWQYAHTQQVINSAAMQLISPTEVHIGSVGELAIAQTFNTAAVAITQGYLQPQLIIKSTPFVHSNSFFQIKAYPNPCKNIVHIETSYFAVKNETLHLRQYDLTGRILGRSTIENEKSIIDISHLAEGSYWFTIYSNQTFIKSFLIQKLN